ncbi:hypothetical protein J6590_001363 [Homalodisca vitripennis]|nr:hypothetical protein J6590_001363 [Homalodisca vitripennis]
MPTVACFSSMGCLRQIGCSKFISLRPPDRRLPVSLLQNTRREVTGSADIDVLIGILLSPVLVKKGRRERVMGGREGEGTRERGGVERERERERRKREKEGEGERDRERNCG